MARGRKTWQEKLEDKEGYPKRLKLEKRFPCYSAVKGMGAEVGDDIVIVNASEVTECMRSVPLGKLTTISEICRAIAERHGVKACCTLVAGIHIMVAANAVEEAASQGRVLDIPYWRTLKNGGYLNEKYPGGAEAHKAKLEAEGFNVTRRGKRYRVQGYDELTST